MTGQRHVKMQVRVSTSPIAVPKQNKTKTPKPATKPKAQTFSSTILTSPSVPQMRRPTNGHKGATDERNDCGYVRDDFVTSDDDDEDAFEPVPPRKARREAVDDLGPRITTDQGLADLPDVHRVFIHQFVDEAKKEVERIRNSKNMKKPIFTEANLREMAANWTTTLESMRKLPNINLEAVDRWGTKLLPLIKHFSDNYEQTMSENDDDRDIDDNHRIEIVLSSDSEIEDDEIDDHGDDDEPSVEEEDEGSRYFQKPTASSKGGRALPWPNSSNGKPSTSKKSGRGGFPFRGKSRGGRRASGRKSNGSTTSYSSAGVSKRKSSGSDKKGGASKASTSNTSKHSSLMNSFGHQGGRGGGGMGGGIGMMPT